MIPINNKSNYTQYDLTYYKDLIKMLVMSESSEEQNDGGFVSIDFKISFKYIVIVFHRSLNVCVLLLGPHSHVAFRSLFVWTYTHALLIGWLLGCALNRVFRVLGDRS